MKEQKTTILYVGQLWQGGTCLMRMQTLEHLGYKVVGLDTSPPCVQRVDKLLVYRIHKKIFGPVDLARINKKIINKVKQSAPGIIWIDKGVTVKKNTLISVKDIDADIVLISYSPDDMMNPANQSTAYLEAIPWYDLHVTTKSYNVMELQELGAKHVMMIGNAYDKLTHKPVRINGINKEKLGGSVGFIGAYEKERAVSLLSLAEAGIQVRIWGMGWEKLKNSHQNLNVENIPLWGDDYARAICSFDINLGFLRKVNRDLQTTRSVEIPACGAFMLAERTDEHLQLFEEGKEAEFFSSTKELIEKVRFYLRDDDIRNQVAQAGLMRCRASGYDYNSRLNEVLAKVNEECPLKLK